MKLFTCDTLPSYLCPQCCQITVIKQNSSVPGDISLKARPTPLCPWAQATHALPWGQAAHKQCSWQNHPAVVLLKSRESTSDAPVSIQQWSTVSNVAVEVFLAHSHEPWGRSRLREGLWTGSFHAVNVAPQESKLSKHTLSCSRPQSPCTDRPQLSPQGADGKSRHRGGEPAICHVARRNWIHLL